MVRFIPLKSPGLRRSLRPAVVGFTALLLALMLACSSATQPQVPAPPAGEVNQAQPSQPASQVQPPTVSAQTEQIAEPKAKAEAPGLVKTPLEQPILPATVMKEPAVPTVAADVMAPKAAEPQPEPTLMAAVVNIEPVVAAEPTAAPAPQQETQVTGNSTHGGA